MEIHQKNSPRVQAKQRPAKKPPVKQLKKIQSLVPQNDRALFQELYSRSPEPEFFVGIDEVGVACLAGPVVACAFAYPNNSHFQNFIPPFRVCDSKTLNENQKLESRIGLLKLCEQGALYGLGEASVEEIDSLNIYHATGLAMERAFLKILSQLRGKKVQVFIDGNRIPPRLKFENENLFESKSQEFELWPEYSASWVIKGDQKSFAVAGASILAKTTRDSYMKELHTNFPSFGWNTNVGYPTEIHRSGLMEKGPTEHHRKSFRLIP